MKKIFILIIMLACVGVSNATSPFENKYLSVLEYLEKATKNHQKNIDRYMNLYKNGDITSDEMLSLSKTEFTLFEMTVIKYLSVFNSGFSDKLRIQKLAEQLEID